MEKNFSTKDNILEAAIEEFLEKGFKEASIRDIAAKVGITSTALYRHFRDKEDIFIVIVQPVVDKLYKTIESVTEFYFSKAEQGETYKLGEGEKEDIDIFVDLIYEDFDIWKLLLYKSEGTKYSDFMEQIVNLEQKTTSLYSDLLRKKGIKVNYIDDEELHLLLSAYYQAISEIVYHDFDREKTRHYIETLKKFLYPGWQNILGF